MAAIETGHFAAPDGIQLQYRVHPADNARAGVLVIHGFAEHGGRYGHLLDALLPAGISVMTWDLRGHGHSGGRRVFVSQFAEYYADVGAALELAAKKLPTPLFVVGHSMGGLIALAVAGRKPAGVAGFILSNPALRNAVAIPKWKEWLALGASSVAPQLSVPSGIPPEHISRDPGEVQTYAADPLNSKVATARWYTEFVAAQAAVCGSPQDLQGTPLLFLLGDGDRIIDSAAARELAGKIAGGGCEVKEYPGFYHELFNEPAADRARVLRDVVAWIDARLA